MIRRAFVVAVITIVPVVGARAEEPAKATPLDIIPADALGAIAIRNVKQLTERGDEFIKQSEVEVPWRLSDGYRFVTAFLGLNRGLDESGSAALMLFDKDFREDSLVLDVPIGDLGDMASNFKLQRADLIEGKLVDRQEKEGENVQQFVRYLSVRGRHLVMGGSREHVELAAKGKPLRDALPDDDRTTLDGDDILLYLNTKPLVDVWEPDAADFAREIADAPPEEADALRKFMAASKELNYLLGGVRLEGGFGSTLLLRFNGEKSREILNQMRGGEAAKATLSALPLGSVLAAHASTGEGDKTAAAARALLRTSIKLFDVDVEQFASAGHRANIVGVFGEVWQRLHGSRSALYENENPERDGAFSLIAVLDTDDAERFVADMTSLTRFVNAAALADDEHAIDDETIAELIAQLGDDEFRIRQLATTKLTLTGEPALPALMRAADSTDAEVRYRARMARDEINRALAGERKDLVKGDLLSRIKPNFAHFPARETRAGRPVDIVQIRLRDEESGYAPQLRRMLGPEWSKLRLATVGKRVVVLLGSNVELFEMSIENVKSSAAGFDADKVHTAFRSRAAEQRTAEFHLSLARAQKLVAPDAAPEAPQDAPRALTSFGLSIAPQGVRLDLFSPFDEIKSIAKRIRF